MKYDKEYLNEVEEALKRLIIKQEFLDRKNGQPKMVQMKQTDYLNTGIKLINLIKKSFTL